MKTAMKVRKRAIGVCVLTCTMCALSAPEASATPTDYVMSFVNSAPGSPGGTPTGYFTYDPDIPAFSNFVVFWNGRTHDFTNNANCIPYCTTGSVAESFQLLSKTFPPGYFDPSGGSGHYGYFWNTGIYSVILEPNTSLFTFGVAGEVLFARGGFFDGVSAYGTWSITPIAQAQPLEVVFTGTLSPGFVAILPSGAVVNWDGLPFSGRFVFDPATANDVINPEGTYHFSGDSGAVLWMSTTLKLPNGIVQSGNDSAQFGSLIQLYRNYSNPAGSNLLSLNVTDQGGVDPHYFHFDWEAVDYLGTASTLFSDPNAGVSYTQPFNLAGEPQFGFINIQGTTFQYHGDFVLSSVSIKPATTFVVFGTGLDASGNPLALGSSDPHYQIEIAGNPQAVVLNPPDPGYFPNDLASEWVWQNADSQPANVTLTFRTTFDLTGFDPRTAVISGLWATDNSGLDMRLNGHSTGIALPNSLGTNYSLLHSFAIHDPAFFQNGINTLEFVVEDTGGVAGFRAQLTGTATPTPAFNFRGFFQPIDNDPVVNSAKAGVAVPVKFSLGGNQGLDIFQAGFPASQPVACDNFATLSSIEETVSAGQSGLTYDASTDQYTYVWKTQKSWANACRHLMIRLTDGSVHIANFQFR